MGCKLQRGVLQRCKLQRVGCDHWGLNAWDNIAAFYYWVDKVPNGINGIIEVLMSGMVNQENFYLIRFHEGMVSKVSSRYLWVDRIFLSLQRQKSKNFGLFLPKSVRIGKKISTLKWESPCLWFQFYTK